MPAETELTARHEEIPAWDDMPDDLKPILARQMEVYAGFLEHTDHHIGRLVDALDDLGVLEDTLVYYIIGDNGAARARSTAASTRPSSSTAPRFDADAEFMAAHIDDFGTPKAYNHFAVGWAHAMDTPYQWTKQVASHTGAERATARSCTGRGIAARGEVRSQFHHVIDVAPPCSKAAGLPQPTSR